jgi:CRP/FNR family cyclic AMP-dependent transcriptional regulator
MVHPSEEEEDSPRRATVLSPRRQTRKKVSPMTTRSAKDYRELLRSGRWFRGLPSELQDALVAAGNVRTYGTGERIFSRGDPPSGLFAALDGGVRVTALADGGKEALLTLVEPPAWFGEIAVFDGLSRTHDAIAEGETTVLQVPDAALTALLSREPRYWRDFALLMTHKLRLLFTVVEEAAVLPIAVRLARRLLSMAEGYGEWHDRKSRVVEVRQDQLAAMLATSRQTANQVLKRLETRGVIRLTYGHIEIRDHAELRREARVGEEG